MSGADPTTTQAGHLIERALASGRRTLLEPEGYALLTALGIGVPPWRYVRSGDPVTAATLEHLGPRVVVKVASRTLTHKTERGGVLVVEPDAAAVREATRRIAAACGHDELEGFLLAGFVPHGERFGAELLIGLRQTPDFGPVVTVGAGGVGAEELAEALRPGAEAAVFASGSGADEIAARLRRLPVTRAALGLGRGGVPMVAEATLADVVCRLLAFGETDAGRHLRELEVNPAVCAGGRLTALDALVTLGAEPATGAPPRPSAGLDALLRPRSIAVVGVSEGLNAGRRILRNVLREGFPVDRLAVIKPGADRIDGVRCYPSLAALPAPVDLCVLAVAAEQIPGAVAEIVDGHRAESAIVIPGGLGEREGTGSLADAVRAHLDRSRATDWGGPVVNGGNCLGVRSVPGRFDTTFIPRHKIGPSSDGTAPVAVIAQSGAFAVARWSKLAGADPRYLISVGNQLDLTVGDYLTHLADDPDVAVFACYVEGFQPGDGRRWLEAARAIVASGRTVVLYRAARTSEGRAAGVSHTAVIAGDYVVTRELAREAGALVADTLDDFDDLLRLAVAFDGRPVGARVGAVTNAGFECVAFGDAAGPLELAPLDPATLSRLQALLEREGLAGVVDARHPLDLTPIMGDAAFAEAVETVLADPHVDVGVVGIVPMTGALQTLAAGPDHGERLDHPEGIAARLAALRRSCPTPFVAVVDGGAAYDPLAAALDAAGIPAFRTVDRAMRALAGVAGRAVAGRVTGASALAGAAP